MLGVGCPFSPKEKKCAICIVWLRRDVDARCATPEREGLRVEFVEHVWGKPLGSTSLLGGYATL
jgi:hypothetical protein